jgi:hypothetical protein
MIELLPYAAGSLAFLVFTTLAFFSFPLRTSARRAVSSANSLSGHEVTSMAILLKRAFVTFGIVILF